MLLSAAVGNGAQILVLVISILLLSLVGTFSNNPGNHMSAILSSCHLSLLYERQ
jgi:hypothetical protein